MPRYTVRTSAQAIEKDFPHIVQMIVPLGGFGKKLDDMYEWHWAKDTEAMRGNGIQEWRAPIAQPSAAAFFWPPGSPFGL